MSSLICSEKAKKSKCHLLQLWLVLWALTLIMQSKNYYSFFVEAACIVRDMLACLVCLSVHFSVCLMCLFMHGQSGTWPFWKEVLISQLSWDKSLITSSVPHQATWRKIRSLTYLWENQLFFKFLWYVCTMAPAGASPYQAKSASAKLGHCDLPLQKLTLE